MTGVMDAAVEAAREAGGPRLLGVKVSIGEATEAVEDALVFAFEALPSPTRSPRAPSLT